MGADYRQSRPPMRGCAGGEMAKRRHFADRQAKKIEEFASLDVQTANLSLYRDAKSLDADCADRSEERGLERFQVSCSFCRQRAGSGKIRVDPRPTPSAGMPWHNNAGAKNTDHANTDPQRIRRKPHESEEIRVDRHPKLSADMQCRCMWIRAFRAQKGPSTMGNIRKKMSASIRVDPRPARSGWRLRFPVLDNPMRFGDAPRTSATRPA